MVTSVDNVQKQVTNVRTDEEILVEIENANAGEGPDPVASIGPELAALAVAALQLRSSEAALDDAVAAARESGHTWQAIGGILGMTRQGALKRFKRAA